MKASKKSSVSIVIPSYNGRSLLEKHLPKIIAAAEGAEIIVVDDASNDQSVSFLKENFPQVKMVVHESNRRFAAACNSGVAAAKGEVVILLNNDVSPKKGFLNPLLSHFEDLSVFAVGCKEIQKEGNRTIESGRSLGAFRRGFVVHWRAKDQDQPTTFWVSGGSAAFRRSMWQKLDGMDTLYQPAYWEDIDLSYRARKRGWKVLFEPASIVYHHHETTNVKELGRLTMRAAAFKNGFLFVWKNITDRKLLLLHFLWLPYHLILTTLRSKGLFFLGFVWAMGQINSALQGRKKEIDEMLYSDKILLNNI